MAILNEQDKGLSGYERRQLKGVRELTARASDKALSVLARSSTITRHDLFYELQTVRVLIETAEGYLRNVEG